MDREKKQPNRRAIVWLGKAFLAGCAAFVLLNGFAFLYSNTGGGHITNPTGATDYIWPPGAFFSRMTEGHTWGFVDENGFNNSYPAEDQVDVLLMGSSHMEAYNVPQDKNLGYCLNELTHRESGTGDYVYNIGTSGHGLTDCLSNLSDALTEYHPEKAVIIETMTLEFSDEQIDAVVNGTRGGIPSYDSGPLYYLQKIPYLKLAYGQMESVLGNAAENAVDLNVNEQALSLSPSDYAEGVDAMLEYGVHLMGDCTLIIFYHPTLHLDQNGSAYTDADPKRLALFRAACEENGVIFLDMTERFLAAYEEEHILPHGFANTAIATGHLNQHGHRMIAEELAELLKELE